jgi:ABC-2 type transport system permease protein
MRRIIFYINLAWANLANSLKSRLSYREDFWAGFIANFMTQMIGVLFVAALFGKVPHLQGWTRYEIFYIYGFSQLTLGLFFLLFSNLFELSERYIVEGWFDRVLLRPLDSFFQVIIERVHFEEISNILVGLMIMGYSLHHLKIGITLAQHLMILGMVLSACLIYLGIFTAAVSTTFWFNDRGSMVSVLNLMQSYAGYPVTIYGPKLKFILSWVIPYAFTAFYPAVQVLKPSGYVLYAWLTPVIGLIFIGIGMLTWRQGVKAYESTGS